MKQKINDMAQTKKSLDKWFAEADFNTMEKVIGVRQSAFSPEDGYQDFVDFCEEAWSKLTVEQKRDLYEMYK